MNKATERAFQDWLKRADADRGQLRTISRREISRREADDGPFLEEALRRAFVAGSNWKRANRA